MAKRRSISKGFFVTTAILAVALLFGTIIGNLVFIGIEDKNAKSIDSNKYKQQIGDLNLASSESPLNRVGSDAYIIASHVLSNKDYYLINGYSEVDIVGGVLGKIKVWGRAEKENNSIHTQLITYNNILSSYQVGLKYDYSLENELIDFYWGKSHKDGSATWDEPEKITASEYTDEWGLSPSEFFTYTISRHTALDNPSPEVYKDNGKTYYRYSITLNPEISTQNYALQLKKMSEKFSKSYFANTSMPRFDSVVFSFVVDEDFVFQSVDIVETWMIYFYGLPLTCNSEISYTFEYA